MTDHSRIRPDRSSGSSRTRRRLLGPTRAGFLAALCALAFSSAASAAGVVEYTTGITSADAPTDLVQGSDGNVWFSEPGSGRMARITPGGTVTLFSAGITAGRQPNRVVLGADGNVWFTENSITGDAYVARITPAGVVSEFLLASDLNANDITAGPDGNLWVRDSNNHVYRVTTAGVVTPFATGIAPGETDQITSGPDGNLWLTAASDLSAMTGAVGRITPTGTTTQFHTGIAPGTSRASIAPGSDGNVWFSGYGVIYRITPAGVVTSFVVSTSSPTYITDLALGSDGALWGTRENFSSTTGGSVYRISTGGTVAQTSCGITPGTKLLSGITSGPGGDLWIASQAGRIIRMPTQPSDCPPLNTSAPQLTGAAFPDNTLACSTGSWYGSPTSYTYQWFADHGVLAGQTSSSLVVLDDPAYIDQDLSCQVTAHNASGPAVAETTSLHAAYNPLVPSNLTPPVISGSGDIGEPVSCTTGTWTNLPTSYSYQWYDNTPFVITPIPGATMSSFAPGAELNEHSVYCRVKATNGSGNSRAISSDDTVSVAFPKPAATTLPSISPAQPHAGDTATCNVGTWTNSPTSYAVAWVWLDNAVLAENSPTYVLAAADAGHQIFCRVVATTVHGSQGYAESAAVTIAATTNPPPPPPPGISPPPVPPPPPPPIAPVITKPSLSVASSRSRSSLSSGLPVSIANVPAGAKVSAQISLKGRSLAKTSARNTRAGTVRLTIRLSKSKRAKIRKGSKLTLKVTIQPASGKTATLAKTVRVT